MVRLITWTALFAAISTAAMPAVVLAQQHDSTVGRIYQLSPEASYQAGCFDPCLCPLGEPLITRGAFVLGPSIPGNVVNFRRVTDIYWTVGDPLETLHTLTGRGSYRVINHGPARLHSLDLTLSVDGGEPQQFFSDFVPADNGAGFLDIPVSLNGAYCEDIVIRVDAAPAPLENIVHYSLLDDSTFQQGCFDPCDCPLEESRQLQGSYNLISLFDTGTVAGFGVTGARFAVPTPPGAQPIRFTGAGQYTIVQGIAGPADIMDLNLRSGPLVTRFDSALQNTQAIFPAVSVSVDSNDRVCFDQVLNINSAPD